MVYASIIDGRSIYDICADGYANRPDEVKRILSYVKEHPWLMKTQIVYGVYNKRNLYGIALIVKLKQIG